MWVIISMILVMAELPSCKWWWQVTRLRPPWVGSSELKRMTGYSKMKSTTSQRRSREANCFSYPLGRHSICPKLKWMSAIVLIYKSMKATILKTNSWTTHLYSRTLPLPSKYRLFANSVACLQTMITLSRRRRTFKGRNSDSSSSITRQKSTRRIIGLHLAWVI